MTHRLFIAIDPPPSIRSGVRRLQSRLAHLDLPVNWEDTDKLHLTLNFLGRIPDQNLGPITTTLTRVAAAMTQFSLEPMFLETLYQRHDNSIIYIGFAGDIDLLKKMQKSLSLSLSKLSLPQPRRFLPHLTIGRLKRTDPTLTKRYLDQIRAQNFRPLPVFTVDKIILYESFLTKAGSHYQKVREFTGFR
ncbi:MAG: 2'-5' RNA ligase [Candidatus Amesbacteria bacterium GW2011_GWA2_47_11]|uniref:RNA 2',3'-cyclic phosphodiesterase n=1 Tax=Candidatus Amesbacteria bacterium GW2011_GWA2_47_11 TaxID=1618357 RepID=A0A0G1REB1_9BACT|nr:MAG: 2'-5' RNA ligase [Candidatus Amesbacteria bacterium GW2011_GWA2_47_11]